MDRSELETEFEDMGLSIPATIIDECVIICITHKISASDLVGSWVAYCASSQLDANDLNKEKLNTLIKTFKIADEHKLNEKKYDGRKSIDVKPNLNELSRIQSNSPVTKKNLPGTDFMKIENEFSVSNIIDGTEIKQEYLHSSSGDIVCDYGRGNMDTNAPAIAVTSFQIFNQESWKHFIFGKVNYSRFDDYVQELVNDIVQKNKLPGVTPLSEMYYAAADDTEITISGSLKLMKKEMFLSSSSYGYVKLDFSEAGHVQPLFMNQIAVVTGTNPDTKAFKVKKIFTNAMLPLPTEIPNISQGNLNMIIAAGPFFSESSPRGTFLKSLVQKAIEFRVAVLILLGPLFETDFGIRLNKAGSDDSLQKCYDDILEAILSPLFSHSEIGYTKVVVLSSWKDVGSYAFYPTPPPNTESRLLTLFPKNFFVASDPSVFEINNVIIAANTSDTLMDLHVSSVNHQSPDELWCAKLSKHIVWQRSLHPSYTASPTVPIDQSLWLEHCPFKKNTPHIVVTCSQLRTFIRAVEGCLVINTGQLVKRDSQKQYTTGTYSKIQLCPPKDNHQWSPETNVSVEIIYI